MNKHLKTILVLMLALVWITASAAGTSTLRHSSVQAGSVQAGSVQAGSVQAGSVQAGSVTARSELVTVDTGCANGMTGRMDVVVTAQRDGVYALAHVNGTERVELGVLYAGESKTFTTAQGGNWLVLAAKITERPDGAYGPYREAGYVEIAADGVCESPARRLPRWIGTWDW